MMRGGITSGRLRLLTFALASALTCSVALAQTASISPQFAQFLNSKSNRDAVETAVRTQISKWPNSCNAISFEGKHDVLVQQPARFSADGRSLTAGAWTESVSATACGVTRRHNVFNIAAGGTISRLQKLVGTSQADNPLQNDAMRYFFAGATKFIPPGCQSFFVSDTRFISRDSTPIPGATEGPSARAWREDWTLWACGKEIIVPIQFVPDATGTTINVSSSAVRLKQ